MPITIRPEGEAALYAQAGQAIGRAQKAEREEQLAFQREQALIEVAERRRQQQAAKDWDLQKMLLNSQQDFAHEQRLRQVELNREARAKEWELEKMQLRSQIDFETEERARQKEYDEFLTTDKYINDKVASGEWTPERAEGPYFMNAYKHSKLNKPEIAVRLGSSTEYVQRLQGVTPQRPDTEKNIFTPANIQKGLGVLRTGAPVSPLGIPLPVLKTKEEHETWAVTEWGPNWKMYVPEAIDEINQKFGLTELKPLSLATMQQFLIVSGGNIEQAKQLAKQAGYRIE